MTPEEPMTDNPAALTALEEATLRDHAGDDTGVVTPMVARLLATLDAARQPTDNPADNGLREALIDFSGGFSEFEWAAMDGEAFADAFLADPRFAALAATPSSSQAAGLDVERLARALHESDFHARYHGDVDEQDRVMARDLASQYARLADVSGTTTTDADTGGEE